MKVVSVLKMSKMASELLLSRNPKISSQWKQESENVVKYAPTATCLPLFPRRMEQFRASQRRRRKARGEGTGGTRSSLSSPAWATPWAWATSGGFPTSATEMVEVCLATGGRGSGYSDKTGSDLHRRQLVTFVSSYKFKRNDP